MSEVIVMPKAGLTMEEGEIVNWLVEVGDTVQAGGILCAVETEKITIEVESHEGGVVRRRLPEGVIVPVGEGIAIVADVDEDISHMRLWGDDPPESPRADESDPTQGVQAETGASTQPEKAGNATTPVASSAGDRISSSPVARRLAEELGVDIGAITGTGPDGRITRSDVEAAAVTKGPSSIEPASKLRKAIAAAMELSATVPQFSLERDVAVSTLEAELKRIGETASSESRPSIADAIVAAVAGALTEHPSFMRSWDDGSFRKQAEVNVGVAVAVPDGLIVPVVNNADRLSVTEIASQRRSLQDRLGRGESLQPSQAAGAVFTVSNLGALGVDRFTALVNPPESGILAVGKVMERDGDRVLTLTLSVDHRVADGVDGARFLNDVVELLQSDAGVQALLGDA